MKPILQFTAIYVIPIVGAAAIASTITGKSPLDLVSIPIWLILVGIYGVAVVEKDTTLEDVYVEDDPFSTHMNVKDRLDGKATKEDA